MIPSRRSAASPFARYGQILKDFGRYSRQGVNIALGTDVAPRNLIEEMRLAAALARVAPEDITTTSLANVFHAATVGGAQRSAAPTSADRRPGRRPTWCWST